MARKYSFLKNTRIESFSIYGPEIVYFGERATYTQKYRVSHPSRILVLAGVLRRSSASGPVGVGVPTSGDLQAFLAACSRGGRDELEP